MHVFGNFSEKFRLITFTPRIIVLCFWFICI